MGDKPKDTLTSPVGGKRKEITPTNTPPQQQKAKPATSHETSSTPTKTTPATPTTPTTPLGAVASGLRAMLSGRIVNAAQVRKGGVNMTVNRSVNESDLEKIIASPTTETNQQTVTISTQPSQSATIPKPTITISKKCGYCKNGCTSPCSECGKHSSGQCTYKRCYSCCPSEERRKKEKCKYHHGSTGKGIRTNSQASNIGVSEGQADGNSTEDVEGEGVEVKESRSSMARKGGGDNDGMATSGDKGPEVEKGKGEIDILKQMGTFTQKMKDLEISIQRIVQIEDEHRKMRDENARLRKEIYELKQRMTKMEQTQGTTQSQGQEDIIKIFPSNHHTPGYRQQTPRPPVQHMQHMQHMQPMQPMQPRNPCNTGAWSYLADGKSAKTV